MPENAARDVPFGELISISARTVQGVWPAVLLVWITRALSEAMTPVLRAQVNSETGYATCSFTALPWLVGLLLALLSGLFIRWLLERRPESLRLDIGLVVYVLLIEAARIIDFGALWLFRLGSSHEMRVSQLALRSTLGLATNLLLDVIFAAAALWPIALMMGDQLSLPAAVKRMSQA